MIATLRSLLLFSRAAGSLLCLRYCAWRLERARDDYAKALDAHRQLLIDIVLHEADHPDAQQVPEFLLRQPTRRAA